jgi:group I intron endonuclease
MVNGSISPVSTCGIYKITIGRFVYYGSSLSIASRIKNHLHRLEFNKHHSPKLQNAFNKYKTFNWLVVLTCDKSELIEKEQFYIDSIWGTAECANARPIADSPLGTKRSKESIRKSVESRSGYRHSEETKKLMSQNRPRTKLTTNTKQKISDSLSKYFKENGCHNKGRKGTPKTAEQKKYMSNKLKGIPRPDSVKLKISIGNKGKSLSTETRKKISNSLKGRKMPETTRLKLIGRNKGIKLSKKTILKQRLSKSRPIVLKFNHGIKEYNGLSFAAESIGVKYATLYSWLSGINPWPKDKQNQPISGHYKQQ